MANLAVIADDLTGANDTGVQFCKAGLKTIVLLGVQNEDLPQQADVLVIDTDSRADEAAVAAGKVHAACQLLERQQLTGLYKKIDSTLRGNIAPEIFAAYEAFQPQLTVIAPAYPKNRRSTIGGYQLLDGLPVSMTELARDPKNPVTEDWLPALVVKGLARQAGIVPLHIVMKGVEAIRRAVTEKLAMGIDWLVFDAVSDENLRHIAQICAAYEKVLWVGSAGLAEQLVAIQENMAVRQQETVDFQCRSVVVAAGSVSTVTRHQLQLYFEKNKVRGVEVDAVAAVANPDQEVRRLATAASGAPEVVLYCSGEKNAVDAAMAAGAAVGLNAAAVGTRIAQVLGQTVAQLVPAGVDGLLLTGGETAIHCCRALQATGINIIDEITPGIPIGRLAGGPFAGLPVVTKAGAFGEIYAIINGVKALQGKKYYESLSGLKL